MAKATKASTVTRMREHGAAGDAFAADALARAALRLAWRLLII
jgi:hypothetical protein